MRDKSFKISGKILDVVTRRIFNGIITVNDGQIASVEEKNVPEEQYILPGLIDAHVHVESSMLIPSEFARIAVNHGTVGTVSDPHEIANVLGIAGVEFMIRNGRKVPFRFYFGAPSCVPATPFESSGAVLGVKETEQLLTDPGILYLSEMMNYPGVIGGDPEVMAKIAVAREHGKPVDGHAPGLKGDDARRYAEAGISTDHECYSMEEALDKIRFGMKVLIREGSAARNLDDLMELVRLHPDMVMFCSDDKHPDDLVKQHIDGVVRRVLARGYDPLDVIAACTLNPVRHYGLDAGLLQIGDLADMIVVDDLQSFRVKETYIGGELVARNGKSLIKSVKEEAPNRFNARFIGPEDLRITPEGQRIKVIEALEGQLVTHRFNVALSVHGDNLVSDVRQDILKMLVMNRYSPSNPSLGFVKGFGLKKGAIASSVAHDSHNIIAVGTNDQEIVEAVNLLVQNKGGICAVDGQRRKILPLPVAGIMSNADGFQVARDYERIDRMAHEFGSTLESPFMTLSFMALLVIPDLKLSDKGLFDGQIFDFTSLFDKE